MQKKPEFQKIRIILDGGVGFQKTYEQNLMVLNRTYELCKYDLPVRIATSKKSVIGLIIISPLIKGWLDISINGNGVMK